ncbi:MAG: SGNH/GDSL hydrolase family protein [Erysipelotrichaceae bacterium]|nr:SGNH/GDSL hydrolase family protein [Erysipelotrichaceae bacterium]
MKKQDYTEHNGNVLYGKKWAVCGDSFTAGVTGSVFEDGFCKGMPKSYPYFIAARNHMEICRFFEGGRTLGYPADNTFHNSLTDPSQDFYYQNIPADADYITIYLGINDSHHEHGKAKDGEDPTGPIPIGSMDDETAATYCGAWNEVLSWLIVNRPFAHLGILVSNGCDREEYRDVQIRMARKYGIPYIDMNGDDHTPVMIRSKNPEISDEVKKMVLLKQAVDYPRNTHPNDDAHAFESYFIEDFLRRI